MIAAEIRNLCKQYPGSVTKANNNISLDLFKGEILCIAGENGAGKTTLMKMICGLEKKDSGLIKINGSVRMVHQHFMLFGDYTAAENIVMGNEPRIAGIFFDKKKALEISIKIIIENNFSVNADAKIRDLSLGEMQQVEICRILYNQKDICNNDSGIIILDEPTSILTEHETMSLFKTLRTLADNGKSVILITHKLHEIKQIADRVAVLRQGELKGVCEASRADLDDISRLMIGENQPVLKKQNKSAEAERDKNPLIAFENVTVMRKKQKQPLLDNVSFNVYPGEILGFAGVSGNGLGVIEAVLGGFLHPLSGKILYRGNDITGKSTRDLRNQGLAYVPADRTGVGSAKGAAIYENIAVNNRGLSKSKKIDYACGLVKKYNISVPDINKNASVLSGGNLQKLILAREIDRYRDYIVFSQPTWGLDAASGNFIMKQIIELKEKGAAVILISTDLDEILSLSCRIIVMYRGRAAGVYDNDGSGRLKEMIGMNMQGLMRNQQ
ncbi:MAG: ATP-binding cassette domain-containing protein [Treponema sp.]|nr:ATP-binding cassette domain-containing protein [Treponema sp.]